MNTSFKPFAVHHNLQRNREDPAAVKRFPRGFTAWIEPNSDGKNVDIRITHCAYNDDFCKKEGVSIAKMQPSITVNPRDVPEYLGAAYAYCRTGGTEGSYYTSEYQWVYKYML